MGPVEAAIRAKVKPGDRLFTPVRERPFVVHQIDQDGVALLLAERWWTRLTWPCLEGVKSHLAHGEWVGIGPVGQFVWTPPTLDAYMRRHVKRPTAAWVAALLERAGVVEINLRHRLPAQVRLRVLAEPVRRVSFRVAEGLHAQAEARAKAHGMTVSGLARHAFEFYLDHS